jgi:hypothetical protein
MIEPKLMVNVKYTTITLAAVHHWQFIINIKRPLVT